jgi:hypothetical protein
MKVQITQSFGVFGGPALQPGDILQMPADIAVKWINQGLAKPYGLQPELPSLAVQETTSKISKARPKRNR